MPIEIVSRLALIRPKNRLYDAIIVSDNGIYVGIVTVKDLLEASVSIQVEQDAWKMHARTVNLSDT